MDKGQCTAQFPPMSTKPFPARSPAEKVGDVLIDVAALGGEALAPAAETEGDQVTRRFAVRAANLAGGAATVDNRNLSGDAAHRSFLRVATW